jgi:hypothetical protein
MKKLLFFISLFSIIIASCKSDYDKTVRRELASGVRNDTIFLGMYFGMPRADFYKHCFQMNQQGLVTNGPENTSVLLSIKDYEHPIDMNFYPAFDGKDRIYLMDVRFNYEAWAPWNKNLYADKLVPSVLDQLERWYGKGFMELTSPDGKKLWVKVNGNRHIKVVVQNEKNVRVEIKDLSAKAPEKPVFDKPRDNRPIWEQPNR